MRKSSLIFILIACWLLQFRFTANGQAVDPLRLIEKVRERIDTIEDYSANVRIIVYVSYINIPPKEVSVFFKKPDKIKFVSDQFFLLPKNNMGFSLQNLISNDFTAIYSGPDTLKGKNFETVKVIPTAIDSDVILAILWINPKNYEIQRADITTRSTGIYTVDFWYNYKNISLPSHMEITFDVGQFTLPVKFLGYENDDEKNDENENARQPAGKGSILLRFTDYEINKGIDDSFFDEEMNNNK